MTATDPRETLQGAHHEPNETSSSYTIPQSSLTADQYTDGDAIRLYSVTPPVIKAETPSSEHKARQPDTILTPSPQPGKKHGEAEAEADASLHTLGLGHQPSKKRKRRASPPWQFPTAETTTLKTADGRRISARVNVGTPGLSGSEGRGRSASVSRPATANHSRPPRPPSAPWRKFEAVGPTTVQIGGVRKSGRVNKELVDVPKRVSPRNKKQPGADSHADIKHVPSKSMGGSSRKSEAEGKKQANSIEKQDRPSISTTSAAKIAELQAKIAALQPTRSFATPEKATPPSKLTNGQRINTRRNGFKEERSLSPSLPRKMQRCREASLSPEHRSKPSPRIKLKVGPRRFIPPPHPNAKIPSPTFPPCPSIFQVLEDLEVQEMQQPYTETDREPPTAEEFAQRNSKQAAEESAMRQKLLKEAEPEGALSKDNLSLYQYDRQHEPPQQYGHHDHLVAHALFFRQLQQREKLQHRVLAKKIAHEAVEKWKTKHGPTEEDLIVERNKLIDLVKKQIVADMKTKWELVEAHVKDLKKQAWESEQERLRAEKLQQKLEWSENLLAKQRGEADSDIDMDDDEDSTGDVDDSDADGEEDLEENMSDSGSDQDDDAAEDESEMDEEALADYLAKQTQQGAGALQNNYEAQPNASDEEEQRHSDDHDVMSEVPIEQAVPKDLPSIAGQEGDARGSTPVKTNPDGTDVANLHDAEDCAQRRAQKPEPAPPIQEEAQAENDLSSDESTNMDSEDYDSDEDMSSTGEEANDDDDDDEDEDEDEEADDSDSGTAGKGLLALYSAKELLKDRGGGLPTPMNSVENGGDNDNPRPQSEGRSEGQAEAGASNGQDQLTADDNQMDDVQAQPRECTPAVAELPKSGEEKEKATSEPPESKSLVPVPTLLRGTLRSYQHAGLDWLASLYRNETNGILADEMGLGKTIQTISLLAHLAEVHEIWETHLVIVPTSVILNWVAEFQKFLPGFRVLGYYGTADERLQKRKGWVNDPHHTNKEKRGYNVVVTSYNVAMNDINAIRAVQWHYLILDEAHNIRNYNSQRWQLLIRLRTRARLLLTGTPLQNDLAEVWSLLTFLTAGDDVRSHGALEEFLGHWKDPVKEIFDQGVEKISENAQRVIDQLHISLRPFLLRRKKNEVEKDLPKKTESVVVCKLSKRQRQLYQDYMGLAETRATLAKGSGIQAGAVLLSLRKVCNHPDLFDPRPIQTSFAMDYSPLESYSPSEQAVRRLLGARNTLLTESSVIDKQYRKMSITKRQQQLNAASILWLQVREIESVATEQSPDPATIAGSLAMQRLRQRERRLQRLRASIQVTELGLNDTIAYPADLRELVTVHTDRLYRVSLITPPNQPGSKVLQSWLPIGRRPVRFDHPIDWHVAKTGQLQRDVATFDTYAERYQDAIVRFAFVPPAATVPLLDYIIPRKGQESIRSSELYPLDHDWGQEARVRGSIAFPDKRLLIYDSGKLQRLTYLLRDLQSRGSRSLIFTQMTGALDILERFLNLLNLPYLRLDGSTPVEHRQLYSAEFNRPDSKYQCMILSSRAGGVGLNLTGASSVIFYDLDWNPQMDRQCMDRAHRIGQVRDVEVYKLVSEKTVEENILRRANQKSLLDETVIQEGHFTTEYQQKRNQEHSAEDDEEGVSAAMDRFLGNDEKDTAHALASVEDHEDTRAAQQASKEDRPDDFDFSERSSKGASKANTPKPGAAEGDEMEEERKGHVDLYMIHCMKHLLQDWVYVPPPVRKLDKHGRDPSHRPKRKR